MSKKIPQHLVKTNAWHDQTSFGIQYEEPYLAFRKLTVGGPVSASEAKIGAEKIGAEEGIPVLDYSSTRMAEVKKTLLPKITKADIKFKKDAVAIPTMGGVITDLPLSADSKMRFPPDVCLRVSEKVANGHDFVIVDFNGDGVGVALHPEEADGLGLKEVQNWLPDMTGISSVPRRGEIERHLQR